MKLKLLAMLFLIVLPILADNDTLSVKLYEGLEIVHEHKIGVLGLTPQNITLGYENDSIIATIHIGESKNLTLCSETWCTATVTYVSYNSQTESATITNTFEAWFAKEPETESLNETENTTGSQTIPEKPKGIFKGIVDFLKSLWSRIIPW